MALLAILFAVPQSNGFATLPTTKHHCIHSTAGRLHADLLESTLLEETHATSCEEPDNSAAENIVRDLDGNKLTVEYFANNMNIKNVESYVCRDAFRDFNGNACRVHLQPGGQTAFFKRIHFATLDHALTKLKKAPFKLARDAQSYQVVASFLSSRACRTLKETTGVIIPGLYDVRSEPDSVAPIQSKFSFLFEDLSPADGWYQEWLLDDLESCEAALSTLAKIHAYFWHGSDFWKNGGNDTAELEAAIWKSGSYIQPTAQGEHQWKTVAKEWDAKKRRFEAELSPMEYWDDLGVRLQSVAQECGRVTHPFAADDDSALFEEYRKYRTFTHGDPKQANLLFHCTKSSESTSSPKSTDASSSTSTLRVGLIDFQWSGFGLAATDIAHFITSAVHADMLIDDGERILLDYYYKNLQTYLVEYGTCRTPEEARQLYSHDTYLEQYDTAVLDLCRLVIAYTWSRFTEPVEKGDVEGCARTMNKTSYNKCIPNTVWLMTKCDELLKARGV
eukprot:CAMPEP_0194370156 /NCGR_PEP_ID=MMETSP0174-20130528/18459_1 /TAXON_ID=216777 /ORGANISM="Proboscia alata, Strain PI-D3" /LENGTH=504 /DNA_ID=CAMNT_0039147459 /DNA_START=189 /DNA_END=1703 /DNA_ORIENTATION=-